MTVKDQVTNETIDALLANSAVMPGKSHSYDAQVILCDAPWTFETYSRKGDKKSPKYDLMTVEEIKALAPTVLSLAGKDCVLLFWATAPLLPAALDVVKVWGFTYKSNVIWSKPQLGLGYWARSRHEHLIIATRGRPHAPAPAFRMQSVMTGKPWSKLHSSKPIFAHTYAEHAFPDTHKVELFARVERPGWFCIGRDLGLDIRPDGIFAAQSVQESVDSTQQTGYVGDSQQGIVH